MRPGNNRASVPNCSAMTSGEWFGSMMPPAPTRMLFVPDGDMGDDQRRRRAGDSGKVVVFGDPDARIAPRLRVTRKILSVVERAPGVGRLGDANEVENRQWNHMDEVERVMGIEPTLVAWEATVLPLNYTRARGRRE